MSDNLDQCNKCKAFYTPGAGAPLRIVAFDEPEDVGPLVRTGEICGAPLVGGGTCDGIIVTTTDWNSHRLPLIKKLRTMEEEGKISSSACRTGIKLCSDFQDTPPTKVTATASRGVKLDAVEVDVAGKKKVVLDVV